MLDRNLEGVPSPKGRGGAESVVCRIGARLSGKMNSHGGACGEVPGMIGPGFRRSVLRNLGWLQRNRGIPFTVEALGPLQADANAPIRLVAKAQKKDGVMGGMRGLRPRREAFLLRLRELF